ncbi:polyketide cyclase/dehydrase/lipid transport protein [Saccharothrix carnea]|uniref:Polyketide cyclase/dehydrase/lipid transport protein n=1 Tax=Saccharothrix carnea TaxID=1280637 RepID=A0A2P8IEG0_SACCR|nr:polyketide cyclase/dehydrase/lipid transport protein [Saccharothrix carnea]
MYHMVQRVDVKVRSDAPPERVYRLAADSATWPDWSPVLRYERERAGDANGVGEVRVFHNRGRKEPTREEVVELTPNRRVGYALLSGLAIRDYRAFIDLTPDDGGTAIRWHSSFDAKVPGTGWLYRLVLQAVIGRYARGLAAHAAVAD